MEKLIKVIDTVNEISFVIFEFFTGMSIATLFAINDI